MSYPATATIPTAAGGKAAHIHILIIAPTGPVAHHMLQAAKAEAAQAARDTVAQIAPGSRMELHWERAFGHLWAIVFIAPNGIRPLGGATVTAPSRYLPDPDE